MLTGKDGCFSVLGLKRGYEDPVFEGSLTILRRKRGFPCHHELLLESYIRKGDSQRNAFLLSLRRH